MSLSEDQAGRVIADRYRITTLLGKGGMGSVWRAEHLTLGSEVAIKLIDPAVADNEEIRIRFVREAKAAAGIRSPHVVQILDYGVDDDVPFIAMELMEGESLAERLNREGKLTIEDTSRIITEVARALSKAHDAGIIHRDLKPDNIFLVRNDDTEIAKVLDFGVAKQTMGTDDAHMTSTGAVMGTPYYMSPEQAEGAKGLDHRTDIWSLAVIAYECLLGARPFESETLGGLFLAICTREKPIPSQRAQVPKGFDDWFGKGIARNVEERYSSARIAAQELRSVCEGKEATTLPNAATMLDATPKTSPAGSGGLGTEISASDDVPRGSSSAQDSSSQVKVQAATGQHRGQMSLSTVAGGAIAVPMRSKSSGSALIAVGALLVLGLGAFAFMKSGSAADQKDAGMETNAAEELAGSRIGEPDRALALPEEEPAIPEEMPEPSGKLDAPVPAASAAPEPRPTPKPAPAPRPKPIAPAPSPKPLVIPSPQLVAPAPKARPTAPKSQPVAKPKAKPQVDLGI